MSEKQAYIFLIAFLFGALAFVTMMYEPVPKEVAAPLPAPSKPNLVPELTVVHALTPPTEEGSLQTLIAMDGADGDGGSTDAIDESVVFQIMTRYKDLAPAQVERYNQLHMIPWRYDAHETCDECPETGSVIDHTYQHYSRTQLERLPDSDPVKHLFLARHEDTFDGVVGRQLLAAALSGKPGELLAPAYMANPSGESSQGDVQALQYRYILTMIAGAMGDERARIAKRRGDLRSRVRHYGGDPDLSVSAADNRAEELLAKMVEWRKLWRGETPTWRLREHNSDI